MEAKRNAQAEITIVFFFIYNTYMQIIYPSEGELKQIFLMPLQNFDPLDLPALYGTIYIIKIHSKQNIIKINQQEESAEKEKMSNVKVIEIKKSVFENNDAEAEKLRRRPKGEGGFPSQFDVFPRIGKDQCSGKDHQRAS